jgi:hypothetical protein
MTNKMFKGPEILGAGKKRKEVSPARALQGGPASISAGPPNFIIHINRTNHPQLSILPPLVPFCYTPQTNPTAQNSAKKNHFHPHLLISFLFPIIPKKIHPHTTTCLKRTM